MKIKPIQCPNCGANVDLDFDDLQKYCEKCGTKLVIDMENLEAILIAREKTKQVAMVEETKRMKIRAEEKKKQEQEKNRKKEIKTVIYLLVGWIVVMLVFGLLGYNQFFGISRDIAWTLDFIVFVVGATAVYAYIVIQIWPPKKHKYIWGLGYYAAVLWLVMLIYWIVAIHGDFFDAGGLFGAFLIIWLFIPIILFVAYSMTHPES